MKRLSAVILCLVLSLALSSVCLAAETSTGITVRTASDESPEKEVVIVEVIDADGNDVPIEIIDIPQDIPLADIEEIMGDDYKICMSITEAFMVKVSGNPVYPVKVVFSVPGATPETLGSIIVYNNGVWERIPTEFGVDQVIGSYSFFGPSAFIVNIEGCEYTWFVNAEYAQSPKTSGGSAGFMLITVISVFMLAAFYCFRKYQEQR